ncbi:WD40 repeat domain-containing protein [Candidatus Poribacteria bacterium]|jgi:WD40 repeat protein|nr:WD40 repeat domain-containing protein [Candidatus Poribacteria bacterium]MBT5531929.1 WD40 repeat domain-containing protein [Candidatus Poribacteria bacterium]MBT5712579.1 WD40 repeat domain-containing protein [Candidatus Poribacteria bacterium]MBT7098872.1 WD40 repeat domain-containing protein [Candidatus Poribacteria bacterium]MBT7804522.1 WD40 repeat domain-containing protein [Candidatus Poribacteria bacterium]
MRGRGPVSLLVAFLFVTVSSAMLAQAADRPIDPEPEFTLGEAVDNPTDDRPPTVPMRVALSSDDSQLLVLRADGSVETWDVAARTKAGTRDSNELFAYAPGDGTLVTRSADGAATASSASGGATSLFPTTSAHAALSGDGDVLAVVGQFGRVDVWSLGDTATSTTLKTALPARNGLAVSRDGALIAAAEGTYSDDAGHTTVVEVWRRGADSPLLRIDEKDAGVLVGVWGVLFSPDGSLLAADTQKDGRSGIRVWELPDGRVHFSSDGFNSYWVRALAFSADGRHLASGDEKGTIWVRGLDGGGTRHIGRPGVVQSLAFSHDGRYLVVGNWDSTVEFWRVGSDG